MYQQTPEPDDFDEKEVFAFFGLAYYQAQVLEQQFVSFAAMLHVTGKTGITRDFIDRLFNNFESRTLGYLFREARRLTVFPPAVDQRLADALERRNHLAHHFFAQHAADFMIEQGRRAMIQDLRSATELFLVASEDLKSIQLPLAENFGLTPSAIGKIMEEELARARAKFGA
jgi:hypothetical protein